MAPSRETPPSRSDAIRIETPAAAEKDANLIRQEPSSAPDQVKQDLPDFLVKTPETSRFDEMMKAQEQPDKIRSPVARAAAEQVLAAMNKNDVSEDRLVLRLKPQGMGIIEIEVIKDAHGRTEVAMKVQNPLVLEALRAERSVISDIIGPQARADSLSMEMFSAPGKQDRGGEQGNGSGNNARGGRSQDVAEQSEQRRETVLDGATDILI